jgi:hypothetical protein
MQGIGSSRRGYRVLPQGEALAESDQVTVRASERASDDRMHTTRRILPPGGLCVYLYTLVADWVYRHGVSYGVLWCWRCCRPCRCALQRRRRGEGASLSWRYGTYSRRLSRPSTYDKSRKLLFGILLNTACKTHTVYVCRIVQGGVLYICSV